MPKVVCDIAWKAQLRLTGRSRRLVARGKAKPKVATSIARELTGFIRAIAREVRPAQKICDVRGAALRGSQASADR